MKLPNKRDMDPKRILRGLALHELTLFIIIIWGTDLPIPVKVIGVVLLLFS